jgi:hypothetical protein
MKAFSTCSILLILRSYWIGAQNNDIEIITSLNKRWLDSYTGKDVTGKIAIRIFTSKEKEN